MEVNRYVRLEFPPWLFARGGVHHEVGIPSIPDERLRKIVFPSRMFDVFHVLGVHFAVENDRLVSTQQSNPKPHANPRTSAAVPRVLNDVGKWPSTFQPFVWYVTGAKWRP